MDDQTQGQSAQPSTPEQPSSPAIKDGYGEKGSWVKWLLIYVVIGLVVYGTIWYFWVGGNGGIY